MDTGDETAPRRSRDWRSMSGSSWYLILNVIIQLTLCLGVQHIVRLVYQRLKTVSLLVSELDIVRLPFSVSSTKSSNILSGLDLAKTPRNLKKKIGSLTQCVIMCKTYEKFSGV